MGSVLRGKAFDKRKAYGTDHEKNFIRTTTQVGKFPRFSNGAIEEDLQSKVRRPSNPFPFGFLARPVLVRPGLGHTRLGKNRFFVLRLGCRPRLCVDDPSDCI